MNTTAAQFTKRPKRRRWVWPLVAGGCFVILMALGIQRWINADKLARFVPTSSAVYMQFSGDDFTTIIDFDSLIGQSIAASLNMNPQDLYESIIASRQSALVGFRSELNDSLDWALLLKKPLFSELNIPDNLEVVELDDSVNLVTSSKQVWNSFLVVQDQKLHNLVSEVGSSAFWRGSGRLIVSLAQISDIESSIAKELGYSRVVLSFEHNNVQTSLWTIVQPLFPKNTTHTTRLPLINTALSAQFVRLVDIIDLWGNIWPELNDIFDTIEYDYRLVYGEEIPRELTSILYQPISIGVEPNGDALGGFDFRFATELNTIEQAHLLQRFMQLVVAQRLPLRVIATLPDDSEVVEQQLVPDIYQWKYDEEGDFFVLKVADLNLSLYMRFDVSSLELATTQELLDRAFTSQSKACAGLDMDIIIEPRRFSLLKSTAELLGINAIIIDQSHQFAPAVCLMHE